MRVEEEMAEDEVRQEPLSGNEHWWGGIVLLASAFDLPASLCLLVVAFKYAYRGNGVSLYCLGIQAVSHWLSSLLLVLRFGSEMCHRQHDGDSSAGLLERRRAVLYREQGISVLMGIVMLISSVSLMFKAVRKFRFWDKWYLDHNFMDQEVEAITEWLAWTGFVAYALQAMLRGSAACKMRVSIVGQACVASIVSLLFLLVLGFAASYEREWSWKAEPIAALGLALFMIVEGIRIIFNHFDDMDDRLRYDPCA